MGNQSGQSRTKIRLSKQKTKRADSRCTAMDALFTATQQRVLALLFGQPNRTFYATEMIALAGSGSGAVQRELSRLTESGLAVVTRVGNQKHFQANPEASIFNELRQIVVKTFGLAGPVEAALVPLAEHIHFAVVFGSTAKRTASAVSDVDLLVISDTLTLEQLFLALGPAERELARKINVTLYTSDEYQRRKADKGSFLNRVFSGEHWVLMGKSNANIATRQSRKDSATKD